MFSFVTMIICCCPNWCLDIRGSNDHRQTGKKATVGDPWALHCSVISGQYSRIVLYTHSGCSLYAVYWRVNTVQCALYSEHCALYAVQWTLHNCTVNTVQCTVLSEHFALYIEQFVLNSVQWTMCTVQCTVNTVYCTVSNSIQPG